MKGTGWPAIVSEHCNQWIEHLHQTREVERQVAHSVSLACGGFMRLEYELPGMITSPTVFHILAWAALAYQYVRTGVGSNKRTTIRSSSGVTRILVLGTGFEVVLSCSTV